MPANLSAVVTGLSRSKNGVASLAYCAGDLAQGRTAPPGEMTGIKPAMTKESINPSGVPQSRGTCSV